MIDIFQKILFVLLLAGYGIQAVAQSYTLSGKITDTETGEGLAGAIVKVENRPMQIISDPNGFYTVDDLRPGTYHLTFFAYGYDVVYRQFDIESNDVEAIIEMSMLREELGEIMVANDVEEKFGMARLRPVQGMAIYASKKNEVVLLENINANLATNNSRQIYSRVPGLNIWESDAAGLQLGIGGRGLSPKRTSNFNTRQNGYDISADAMGYPESYYTPPAEALKKIEIVRGAASLQYGTQFGGMINFELKGGPTDKKIQLVSRQTIGSFGLFNSFNSLGGTVGKLNYYTYYNRKQGKGWRPNTSFESNTAFININYNLSENVSMGLDFTHMDYLAQQPGGLNDTRFDEDPSQSIRERNWFKVSWNLPAFWIDYRISNKTKINLRTFGLIAERSSLGFLGRADRADPLEERDLIDGTFNNWGTELRFMQHYRSFFGERAVLLLGSRYYQGYTRSQQGFANDAFGADFDFLPGEDLKSSHRFPSENLAFFAENVFHISPKLTITPGIRYEHISTRSKGYYQETTYDLAGNIILEQAVQDSLQKERSFVLFGLGTSYKLRDELELYANFSQNYRAINFNDLRIDNPNFRIDENLQDEKGYNGEIGLRGHIQNLMRFDVSLFYLKYNNRIGVIHKHDTTEWTTYRFRTNVADARSAGVETYMEADIIQLLTNHQSLVNNLLLYANLSYINARYINTDEAAYRNNKVEFVPELNAKTGLTFLRNNFSITYQYAFTQAHYSDATNASWVSDAISGTIPSYTVMDLSASYTFKFLKLETGINNLANRSYFTYRAAGYPGPGIIPAQPRTFYITLQVKI